MSNDPTAYNYLRSVVEQAHRDLHDALAESPVSASPETEERCGRCGRVEDALCEHDLANDPHAGTGPYPVHRRQGVVSCLSGHPFVPESRPSQGVEGEAADCDCSDQKPCSHFPEPVAVPPPPEPEAAEAVLCETCGKPEDARCYRHGLPNLIHFSATDCYPHHPFRAPSEAAGAAVNPGFCPSCLKPEDYCVCVVNTSAAAPPETPEPAEGWRRVGDIGHGEVHWRNDARDIDSVVPLAVEQAIAREAAAPLEARVSELERELAQARERATQAEGQRDYLRSVLEQIHRDGHDALSEVSPSTEATPSEEK